MTRRTGGRRRCAEGDEGSALVLSLMVVTVAGVLLAAALDFTSTGLTLAPKLRNERNEVNFAQGAVDAAIESVRGSSVLGRTDNGVACPAYDADVPSGILGVSGKTFRVECTAKAATNGGSGQDQPDWAILALGTGSEGVRQSSGNALLNIAGGVYSQGVVSVTAGAGNTRNRMAVTGSVYADGSCTSARIVTTELDRKPKCDRGTAPAPKTFGGDPDYVSSIVDDVELTKLIDEQNLPFARGADPVPTCAAPNGTVTFYPGYYSERPDVLQAALAPGCNGSVWNFRPGRYYFDYAGLWNLGSPKAVRVIGGDTSSTTLGSACDTDGDTVSDVPGVQFVFGGASQMSVTGLGGIELCSPQPTQTFTGMPQRISLYGVNNGNGTPTPGQRELKATADPTSSGALPFVTPELGRKIDTFSTPALTIPKGQSASLDYSAYETVPRGARITAVKVKVAHTLTDGATAVIKVTSPSKPTAGNSQTFAVPASCVDWCVTVPVSAISSAPAWRDVNKLALTYTASTPNSNSVPGVAQVDGIDVLVEYTLPTLRTLSCGSPTCTFLNSTVNLNVFIHGTVYTPSASLAVQVQNTSGTIFSRGVIVRNLDINVSASSTQQTAPFQLPNATPFGRRVLFRGFVDNVERIRACAFYTDHATLENGKKLALAGHAVAIPHWAVLRSPTVQDPDCF